MSEQEYARFVAQQWSLASAEVGVLLDGLCRDFGLDPVKVWRGPRQWRRDVALLNFQHYCALSLPTSGPDFSAA